MAKEETMIALMAGYLSKDAAMEDFQAVKACGADLVGQAVIAKDLEGTVTVEVHDTAVKTLTKRLGGAGFIVGLFAPPLLIATAVGAAVGAGVGEVVHKKIEAGIRDSAGGGHPHRGRWPPGRIPPCLEQRGRGGCDACGQARHRHSHRPAQEGAGGGDGRRGAWRTHRQAG